MTRKRSEGSRPIVVTSDSSPHKTDALRWTADAAKPLDTPVVLPLVVLDLDASPGCYLDVGRSTRFPRRFEEAANI